MNSDCYVPLEDKKHFFYRVFNSASIGGEKIFSLRYQSHPETSVCDFNVFIIHGATEWHGRHQEIIFPMRDYFKNFSFSITWIDLVGHGKSGGTRSHVSSFDIFSEDLKMLCTNSIAKEHFLFGHSMGGLLVLWSLLKGKLKQNNFKGVILSAPCLKVRYPIPMWVRDAMEKIPQAAQTIKLKSLHSHEDLCSDPILAHDYLTDPFVSHFVSIGLGKAIISAAEEVRVSPNMFYIPMLFLIAGKDIVVDSKITKVFASGVMNGQVKEYPKSHHDLMNDKIRNKIFKDIFVWIEKGLKE